MSRIRRTYVVKSSFRISVFEILWRVKGEKKGWMDRGGWVEGRRIGVEGLEEEGGRRKKDENEEWEERVNDKDGRDICQVRSDSGCSDCFSDK